MSADRYPTQRPAEPQALAWIDQPTPGGHWGTPEELAIPLADRGLLLADGVFETVLILSGAPQWLGEHLERWHRSACLLGMAPPPQAAAVVPLINEAIHRSGISCGALRLNWSRGCAGRGINLPASPDESQRFWLQLHAHTPRFEPWRVIVSATEVRSATSVLSQCKTFAYGPSIQARRQAHQANADDALLLSSTGEVCCGTTANLLVRNASGWITPPVSSGCLPGIMRQRALDLGRVQEQPIHRQDLLTSTGAWLINSLGCRPISHLDEKPLPLAQNPAGHAESLWRQLLPDALGGGF